MRHEPKKAFARAIEIKGDTDDASDLVTKALADLQKSVDDRLKAVEAKAAAIETKADTATLVDRLDKIEAKVNRPGTDKTDEISEERKSFGTYLRLGNRAREDELKALTVSSDPQGGYLAPKEISTEFVRNLVQYSPVRQIASVRQTGFPSVVYPARTGVTNAKWKGEGQTQESSEPAFGGVEVVAKELNTYVDISNQLLADSAQAEAEVRLALAEDFGQKEGAAFINGDGVLQPEGLMTNAAIANTVNGHATVLAADPLIVLMYALPAAYRANGTWAMNGNTLATIRKLKDGQGNYLWQPSYQAGQPETVLGRPVVEMVDMPDIAANAFPILFGDFAGYRIVDRADMSVLVNPYILATQGLTRIHATRRLGGAVIQAARFRKLKMSV